MKIRSFLLAGLLALTLALPVPATAKEVPDTQQTQDNQQGQQGQDTQEKRKPVKLEGMSVLPLRVLARPFSNVYKEKDPAKGTVLENVTAFRPFYVYAKPTPEEREMGQGWYEVGTDNRGTVIGWMKADDVFEWKQTMCLAYTHPQGRKPVLMFDSRKDLAEMVQAPEQDRQAKAEGYYQAIESRQVPENFPIKSVEPQEGGGHHQGVLPPAHPGLRVPGAERPGGPAAQAGRGHRGRGRRQGADRHPGQQGRPGHGRGRGARCAQGGSPETGRGRDFSSWTPR